MKESTKVDDDILNEYIMNNNSEIPQTNKHLLTPHSLKNNLNIKIQSRRNSLKNKKPKKYNPNTTNNIKASFQYNNFIFYIAIIITIIFFSSMFSFLFP